MKRTRTYIATICALALVLCFYTQQSAMAEIGHTLVTLPENDDVASDTNLGDNQWCLIGPPYRPQRPGAVRVIISALHDTNYHSGTDRDGSNFQYQSEDGVVEVTARVRVDWNSDALDQLPDKRDALAQKILGTPVWFLVMDPPDESVYIANGLNRLQGETQHYIGDNHDPTIKRGKLSAAPTYTAWAETIVKDGNTIGIAVLPKYVRTEHSGNMDYRIYEAKVRLETTHRYGGDNYIVLARFNEMNPTKYQDSSGKHVLDVSMNPFTDKGKYAWGCSPSGTMYAWKRIYLEVDTMFRTGSYLVANAAAGQKQIQLASVAGLAANDKIYVFGSHDVNTDKCEAAEIESINQDTKTITVKANLTNAYNKGVKDNDAAIGKRILKANGDIDDAATFYTIPDYISDVLKQCYEPAFVEFVEVPDPQFEAMNFPKGRGWLPYDASVAPGADERERNLNLQVFSQRWFKNKEPRADDLLLLPDDQLHNVEPHRAAQNTGKENYFHLMLAKYLDTSGSDKAFGRSVYNANAIAVFFEAIWANFHTEDISPSTVKVNNAYKHFMNHEIGHQFQLGYNSHCNLGTNAYKVANKDEPREDCIMSREPEFGSPNEATNGIWRFCMNHIYNWVIVQDANWSDKFKVPGKPGKCGVPAIRDVEDRR